jgi:Flp pilus assembly protein TadD
MVDSAGERRAFGRIARISDATVSEVGKSTSLNAPHRRQLAQLRIALRTGEVSRALATLDRLLQKEPLDAELWVVKAIALKKSGASEDASMAWQRAVALHARHDHLARSMAYLAREQRQEGDEMWALAQALSIRPEQETLLTRLFFLQRKHGDIAGAAATADRLVASNPGSEPYLIRQATCLIEMERLAEANVVLSELVVRSDASDMAVGAWAHFLVIRTNRVSEAVEKLTIMAARPEATWVVHWWLGKALVQSDRPVEAIAALMRAAELRPGQPKIWHDLAIVQRHLGFAAASEASFSRSLELEPNNPSALRIAGYEHKYEYGDVPFRRVTLALARVHRFSKPSQVEVHYAAAKALEDVDDLDAAFEHYKRAGEVQKTLTPWSEMSTRRLLTTLKREFTPAAHRNLRSTGYPSNKAVFVVGMPRSGTSLIEQIIASHPQVHGAGEIKAADAVVDGLKIGNAMFVIADPGTQLGVHPGSTESSLRERGRRYIESIEGIGKRDALRIVNKKPGNYAWLGLLDAAIPGSYFIHSCRHPVDTCLSAYRLYFGAEVPFSYDLRDLGRAFRLYHAFMTYWSQVIPKDRLLHVRHEDVAKDLEGQVRRIVEFIELPWNDACLAFFDNHRIVRTASAIQVRRPIYSDPIDRWRKYERYLGPLLEVLADLVPLYERSRET